MVSVSSLWAVEIVAGRMACPDLAWEGLQIRAVTMTDLSSMSEPLKRHLFRGQHSSSVIVTAQSWKGCVARFR